MIKQQNFTVSKVEKDRIYLVNDRSGVEYWTIPVNNFVRGEMIRATVRKFPKTKEVRILTFVRLGAM